MTRGERVVLAGLAVAYVVVLTWLAAQALRYGL
jgi:hypothetical protein